MNKRFAKKIFHYKFKLYIIINCFCDFYVIIFSLYFLNLQAFLLLLFGHSREIYLSVICPE